MWNQLPHENAKIEIDNETFKYRMSHLPLLSYSEHNNHSNNMKQPTLPLQTLHLPAFLHFWLDANCISSTLQNDNKVESNLMDAGRKCTKRKDLYSRALL